MPRPVQYPASIEPLVRFIEDTPPAEIVDRTLEKLRNGTPIREMLTASALAVSRSSDLPPGHHGGPLHPVVGIHAIGHLAERLEGDNKFLPVVQHVALSNKHIHHPAMGPYVLLEYEPEDCGTIEKAKEAFAIACNRGESNKADHIFLWLWDNMPEVEVLDLLLTVAIPKNIVDDHYFAYPGFAWRTLDYIGREHLKNLMRPVVRYVTRFPTAPAILDIDEVIEENDLLNKVTRMKTGGDENEAVGALGEAIGAVEKFTEIPKLIGKALADGLSLEGAGEALSIGAATLFMRSKGGNPMDVHLHTSCNIRRYLLGLDGIGLRNKILLLLTWHSGPEIRSTAFRMNASPFDPQSMAKLPPRSQPELLAAIRDSIYTQPETDWSKVANLGQLMAVPEVQDAANLAQQYVDYGYDEKPLIMLLAEIVCRDNFTEMHAFKHHQAIIEEYYSTREPWRGRHLVCGVRAAAISSNKSTGVFDKLLELIDD
jgi:hypothetical protein